jgi:hypothetical protein
MSFDMTDQERKELEQALAYLDDACFMFSMRENALYIDKMKAVKQVLINLKERAYGE